MKHVLLFADIGGHDYENYYHVGDEAMWYATYRWYQENHPNWKLSTLSWFATHSALQVAEFPHLFWPKKRSVIYFPLLVCKLFLWRIIGVNFFSAKEFALVNLIKNQDRIHFTGGGNLSSQFRQWLYYSFFIIIVAKMYGKKVVLTSQTIGPIRGVDRLFAFLVLNLPDLIAIRAKTSWKQEFKKYGAFRPVIMSMLDAAYTPSQSPNSFPKRSPQKIIGLSIHAWPGFEEPVKLMLQKLFRDLSKKYNIKFVLLPHHLVKNKNGPDLEYMQQILSPLSPQKQTDTFTVTNILKKTNVPAEYVKQRTTQVDILLTTRYHGLVFALAENIPTLALQLDEYYQMKNQGVLEFIYRSRYSDYQISLLDTDAQPALYKKLQTLLENLEKEKSLLKRNNDRVSESENTLHAVLLKFETDT